MSSNVLLVHIAYTHIVCKATQPPQQQMGRDTAQCTM